MRVPKYNFQEHGYIPFAILLLAYTLYRAIHLSITHDEALSYFHYARDSYSHIISNHDLSALNANNHILNSVLVRFFCKILPLSEFTLRLPALIGQILYLVYSWRLLPAKASLPIKIAAYLLLNVQPYMLDFFSLSRGYGLSIGCMMAGFYYLLCLFKLDKRAHWHLPGSVVFMGLGVLANLSLLIVFVAIVPIMALATRMYYKGLEDAKAKRNLMGIGIFVTGLLAIPLMYFAVKTGLKLREAGALFYGGGSSFWKDTVISLGTELLYNVSDQPVLAICFFNAIILLSVIMLLALPLSAKANSDRKPFLALFAILAICVCVTIAQHHWLHVLFPMGRTALYYFPLFTLALIYAISHISSRFKWAMFMVPILSSFSLIHFTCSANLHYVLDWKGNAYVKEAVRLLEKQRGGDDNRLCIIGVPWNDEPPFRFYKEMRNLGFDYIPFGDKAISYKEDIVFGSNSQANEIKSKGYTLAESFPASGVGLFIKSSSKGFRGPSLLVSELFWGHELSKPNIPMPAIALNHLQGSEAAIVSQSKWRSYEAVGFFAVQFGLYTLRQNNDCKVFVASYSSKDSMIDFKVYPLAYERVNVGEYNELQLVLRMPVFMNGDGYMKIWFGNDGDETVYISNPRVTIWP